MAAPYYLHWGVVQISLANAVVIALMVIVFVLALVVPFPGDRSDASRTGQPRHQREDDDVPR